MQTNDNIFKQIRLRMQGWAANERKAFSEVAKQRNPAHSYDEALLAVKAVLLLCIAITAGFGIYFHTSIFSAAGGSAGLAVAASLLLFITAEVLKITFSRYLLRAIFSGAWMRDFSSLGLSVAFAVICTGAFAWSMHISTKATKKLNLLETTGQVMADTFPYPAEALRIDQEIAAATEASRKAQRSTWKGRPTTEGLAAMKRADETKQQLLMQREAAIERARKDWEDRQDLLKEGSMLTASTLSKFGGWAEWLTIFLLIVLELLMVKAYQKNAQPSSQYREVQGKRQPETQHETATWNMNPIGFQMRGKAETKPETATWNMNPIGFQMRGKAETKPETAPPPSQLKQAETVVITAFQPETKPEKKLLKQTVFQDDIEELVLNQVGNIQRYFWKWERRGKGGGKPETILRNLEEFFSIIQQLLDDGSEITEETKQKVAEMQQKLLLIKTQK